MEVNFFQLVLMAHFIFNVFKLNVLIKNENPNI